MRRLAFLVLLVLVGALDAQTNVRVATYNIKFLNAQSDATRKANVQSVIGRLGADVIALEEIADRAALQNIFPAQEWLLVIDDDSGDDQDVALAVRKPWSVVGVNADLDADDNNFLFPGPTNNPNFPNRRDLLAVEVKSPDGTASFTVMVVHAKARFGGPVVTDPRRVGHAWDLVDVPRQRFDDSPFVPLGDFNDNPDDKSLNILETGNPNALGGPENIDGPFLFILTERLLLEDRVSHVTPNQAFLGT